ncbi:hypothetical protein GJ496_006292 [Pomphorhynchus laevis]|nr:hypothetical protein GJ496_006292 [Pomphorhynchus laevis]
MYSYNKWVLFILLIAIQKSRYSNFVNANLQLGNTTDGETTNSSTTSTTKSPTTTPIPRPNTTELPSTTTFNPTTPLTSTSTEAPKPVICNRKFDAASFFGGIFLASICIALSTWAYKRWRGRRINYNTLNI